MLHKLIKDYLDRVEQAVLRYDNVYVERYVEEIVTPERVNLRIRLRLADNGLLEIHEAVIVSAGQLMHLDYRYHCQNGANNLRFRYDCTPHFPGLPNHPHHKHLPDTVIGTQKPDLETVFQEAINC